jgi:hypothetical protein
MRGEKKGLFLSLSASLLAIQPSLLFLPLRCAPLSTLPSRPFPDLRIRLSYANSTRLDLALLFLHPTPHHSPQHFSPSPACPQKCPAGLYCLFCVHLSEGHRMSYMMCERLQGGHARSMTGHVRPAPACAKHGSALFLFPAAAAAAKQSSQTG